ncbi:MAG: UdgX family uracil-DNA binding protein [Pseudomonadota bacterium]
MREIVLASPDDREGWRRAARALEQAGVPPDLVTWRVAGEASDLFAEQSQAAADCAPGRPLPKAFLSLTNQILLHRDPQRFALAYRLLLRLRREAGLLACAADPELARAEVLAKAVRRDLHKMKAFVRFRAVTTAGAPETLVAWFEPDHHILHPAAGFFQRRFAALTWTILTPDASVHCAKGELTFGPGASRAEAPDEDALEELWRSYFAAIFNPARLKVKAMTAEMPKKYWRNLPEAQLIKPLIESAEARARTMVQAAPTQPSPAFDSRQRQMQERAPADLKELVQQARGCRLCPHACQATQMVPGEGPVGAPLFFLGEQPGDQEDLAGRPFVGPAGQLLDKALERVGIAREAAYVTNAVKHFKYRPSGKKRLHQRPSSAEIDHCRWWVSQERRLVGPRLIVALGATAAESLYGSPQRVSDLRGQVRRLPDGGALLVTNHPAALLRLRNQDEKREAWRAFLADLSLARDWVAEEAA